jgi:cellulose biosynthesis protein BcsQ
VIIALWGNGGVGKTTLAVHLARILSENQRVLIISGSMTHCGIRNWFGCLETNKSLSKIIRNVESFKENVEKTKYQNVDFTDISIEETCITNSKIEDTQVHKLIKISKDLYDTVIIDCHVSFKNNITKNALLACDQIIYILSPSLKSLSFYKSHKILFDKLKLNKKTNYIVNKDSNQISLKVLEEKMGFEILSKINYEKSFEYASLHGTLLSKRKAKRYYKNLSYIAEEISEYNE